MSKIVVVSTVVAIVLIAGGGYLVLSKKDNSSVTTVTTQSTQQAPTDNNQTAAVTITYGDKGFDPASVTVKSGDVVAIKNASSSDMQLDSDPHPAHTNDEELNVGVVSPGQTTTFKVTTKGTHGYHNHLNSSDTGTIIVQ